MPRYHEMHSKWSPAGAQPSNGRWCDEWGSLQGSGEEKEGGVELLLECTTLQSSVCSSHCTTTVVLKLRLHVWGVASSHITNSFCSLAGSFTCSRWPASFGKYDEEVITVNKDEGTEGSVGGVGEGIEHARLQTLIVHSVDRGRCWSASCLRVFRACIPPLSVTVSCSQATQVVFEKSGRQRHQQQWRMWSPPESWTWVFDTEVLGADRNNVWVHSAIFPWWQVHDYVFDSMVTRDSSCVPWGRTTRQHRVRAIVDQGHCVDVGDMLADVEGDSAEKPRRNCVRERHRERDEKRVSTNSCNRALNFFRKMTTT